MGLLPGVDGGMVGVVGVRGAPGEDCGSAGPTPDVLGMTGTPTPRPSGGPAGIGINGGASGVGVAAGATGAPSEAGDE